MRIKKIVTGLVFIFLSMQTNAQMRDYDSYNKLGIQAGITYGGLISPNFDTSPQTGLMGGLSTRANLYRQLLIVYGVNFYQFKTELQLQESLSSSAVSADFTATGVQINLFGGYRLLGENLSIEAGPVLQVSSKWKPDAAFEDHFIENTGIRAKSLEEASKINLNLAANLSTGFRDLKFWFQYQYGINNILKNIEPEGENSAVANPEGRMSFATAGMVFYF